MIICTCVFFFLTVRFHFTIITSSDDLPIKYFSILSSICALRLIFKNWKKLSLYCFVIFVWTSLMAEMYYYNYHALMLDWLRKVQIELTIAMSIENILALSIDLCNH